MLLFSIVGEVVEKFGCLCEVVCVYNCVGLVFLCSGRFDYVGRCWIRELRVLEVDDFIDLGMLV